MKRMILSLITILASVILVSCQNPVEDPTQMYIDLGPEVTISPTALAGFTVGETRSEIEAKLGDRISRYDPGDGGVFDWYATTPALSVYYVDDLSLRITIFVTNDVDVVSEEFRVNSTTTYNEIAELYSDLEIYGSESDTKIIARNDDYHFEFYGSSGGPHYLGELEIDG